MADPKSGRARPRKLSPPHPTQPAPSTPPSTESQQLPFRDPNATITVYDILYATYPGLLRQALPHRRDGPPPAGETAGLGARRGVGGDARGRGRAVRLRRAAARARRRAWLDLAAGLLGPRRLDGLPERHRLRRHAAATCRDPGRRRGAVRGGVRGTGRRAGVSRRAGQSRRARGRRLPGWSTAPARAPSRAGIPSGRRWSPW